MFMVVLVVRNGDAGTLGSPVKGPRSSGIKVRPLRPPRAARMRARWLHVRLTARAHAAGRCRDRRTAATHPRMNPRSQFLSLAAALSAAVTAQSPLTVGNLVVVSVATGSNTAAVSLDEYTPAGALVQSIALPTAPSGTNRQLTLRGNASSEGFLGVSTDGRYLLLAGYDAPVGTPGTTIEASTAVAIPRVVARVDLAGTVDTSTALVDAYDGSASTQGNVRAVASVDGQSFWLSGTGITATAGIRYVAATGATSSLLLNAGAPTNCRVVGIFDGQLYTSSASGAFLGVGTVGTGLPTLPGQQLTLLPGFPVSGGTAAASTYDFFWADPSTVYVADDNAPASTVGGISKWTLSGGTWSRAYRLTMQPTPTSNWGARALTGFVRDGVATLWATMNTGSGSGTALCTVTDTGPASVVTQLVASPAGTAFRGVCHLARPGTVVRVPASCGGAAQAGVYGNAEIGTDVRTTITGATAVPLVIYGVTQLGVQLDPVCGCILGPSLDVVVATATSTLRIPDDPMVIGITIYTQGVDLFASGSCSQPFAHTLTDWFAFTAQ
jgi:hypothetical protein